MRSRNLLHLNKIDDFAKWLEGINFKREDVKSCYEVLRMRHPEQGVLMVYKKDKAKEHCTTFGLGGRLVRKFIRSTK